MLYPHRKEHMYIRDRSYKHHILGVLRIDGTNETKYH